MTGTDVSEESEGSRRKRREHTRSFRRRLGRAVFLFVPLTVSVAALPVFFPREERAPAYVPAEYPEFGDDAPSVFLERAIHTSFETDAFPAGPFTKREPVGLERGVRELVAGYPIEVMAPVIVSYDREVAALIVGIAKKESDWGRHAPSDAEGDCFNYWGYKGVGSRGTVMGYGCFGSPEEATEVVGDRIARLVEARQSSGPEKLIVWKCGSSCSGHDPESVRKWISDVRVYYDRVMRG